MKKLVLAMCLAVVPSGASAAWYKAASDHFVVYADDSPADIKRFSEMLEKFHSAMEFVTGQQLDTPSPSSRVTIYVVGSKSKVRKLYGEGSRFVAGFYNPRAAGSVAFVPDVQVKWGVPKFSLMILLHEYAHHFMISSSRFEMPRWMNEGAAEFLLRPVSRKTEQSGSVARRCIGPVNLLTP